MPTATHPFDKIVSDTCEGDFSWNDYFVIVEEGSNVNFGCNFDCKGKCSGTRCRDKSKWETKSEKGCCVSCAEDKGYLHNVPIEAVPILEALWNEVDGFWTSEGCTLPAKYRSWTCNAFVCNMAKKSRHFDRTGYRAWRDKQTGLRASARLVRLKQCLQSAETEKDIESARQEEIKRRRKAAKAESSQRRQWAVQS